MKLLAGAAAVGVTAAAWAVRGRSSEVFGASVWHGDPGSRSIALTFDDGPSPGTPEVMSILEQYGISATFFQCGVNVLGHADIAMQVRAAGHEIGNHSHTHPNFALRSRAFIKNEFRTGQQAIVEATGYTPTLLRAPFGIRWFGFRETQAALGLTGVMWSIIGLDWKLGARDIAARVVTRASGGDIICLHDGRGTLKNPDIANTVEALRRIVPELMQKGYHFETVTQLLCPMKTAPTA